MGQLEGKDGDVRCLENGFDFSYPVAAVRSLSFLFHNEVDPDRSDRNWRPRMLIAHRQTRADFFARVPVAEFDEVALMNGQEIS